jgi:hypothetical protein
MSSTEMRALSVVQQGFALHSRFPDGRGVIKGGRLVWTTVLQPTPLSRSYRVEITYDGRGQPLVRVLDELPTRDGAALPHTYVGGFLCVHEPDDWAPAISIADTIVAWTSEWLAHYELWLSTGDWYGGGEWPQRRAAATDVAAGDADTGLMAKEPPTA